ncbi:serine hydrolase [Corallococcus sp. bb12-1]|uniref:serine hydrolase domain-containing protein n=1 Tax=Corallococcus sp. bb12-1 TaxID=2996784 RepID=UPI002270BD5F|nr:serine hydrolase domain-containing protein [Corallococcus sp. bb12-1]MCY1041551.1 serine hydrolase [Corallococcus sp. bb12-1]
MSTGALAEASPLAPDAGSPWSAVSTRVASRAAAAGVTRMGIAIYDAQDRKVFEQMVGDFTPDERVAVASSSKMVSGVVLFDVIRQGLLSLDSTTGQVLGWTGDKAGITLRHLLSFTSGLEPNHACTSRVTLTLQECVAQIATVPVKAPPGTRFDYGGVHLQVAARMAEVVTHKGWNTLFTQTLATPLGLPSGVTYYTAPTQMLGTTNPLVAGGLRASMNEYAKLLALVFHRGRYAGLEKGTLTLFTAQTREPYPSVTVGNSPMQDVGYPYRYGLTAWLECSPVPALGCPSISSPGAFGWTPWLDRDAGYYAILGMQLGAGDATGGVVSFSVDLEQELQPLIRTALGN